jgi:O-antigen/teichoic acid export membrane protein
VLSKLSKGKFDTVLVFRILTAISIRAGGALSTLFLSAIVVRTFSTESSSLILGSLSYLAFLSVFMLIGLPTNSLKFFSRLENEGEQGLLKVYSTIYILLALFFLVTLTALLNFFSLLSSVNYIALYCLIPLGIIRLVCFFLQSLGHSKTSTLFMSFFIPFTMIFVTLFFVSNIRDFFLYYLFVSLFVLFFVTFFWYKIIGLPSISDFMCFTFGKLKIAFQGVFKMWVNSMASQWLIVGGQIIAISYFSDESIVEFILSQKVANAVGLVIVVVNLIMSPKFSVYFHRKDYDGLLRLLYFSTTLATFFSMFYLILVAFFPGVFVYAFGNSMADAGTVLLIFGLIQLLNSLSGSVKQLLLMTNNVSFVFLLTLCSCFILTSGAFYSVSLNSIIGVAYSVLCAYLFQTLASYIYIYRFFKFGLSEN